MKSILSVFLVCLVSCNSKADYPVVARQLTWEEAQYMNQCSVRVCMADDYGNQYLKSCEAVLSLNHDPFIMTMLFSQKYGDCYCPCVDYFIEEVNNERRSNN